MMIMNQTLLSPLILAFEDNHNISLLGSCDGLILININSRELYLWNPSTRKANNILNASFPQETRTWRKDWHGLGCGLGYDALTNDYKVVFHFYRSRPPLHRRHMFMYSSRTDSWKKIPNFINKGSVLDGPATFVNGRLHWLTRPEEEEEEEVEVGGSTNIVFLDFVEEKYQMMAHPPHCYSNYDDPFWPVLADLGGNLSFIFYNHTMNAMDVWVMKKESWSKVWTFSDHQISQSLPMPIWLKKNGDIVVAELGSNLVIYRGKHKLRQYQAYRLVLKIGSIFYVESLVSPFGDDDEP